jgi:hypothetical protein
MESISVFILEIYKVNKNSAIKILLIFFKKKASKKNESKTCLKNTRYYCEL